MVKNNTPTLKIEDIALIKQFPEEYLKKHVERLTKTHDGTSSGPIRNHLKNFITEKSTSLIKHYSIVSNDGEEIQNVKLVPPFDENPYGTTNALREYDYDEINDEIKKSGETGLHLITNEGAHGDYTHVGQYTMGDKPQLTLPGNEEIEQLGLTNDDGDFLVQSVTLVGKNGSSVTLAKYNDFAPEDVFSIKSITESANNDINHKNNEASTLRDNMLQQKANELAEQRGSSPSLAMVDYKNMRDEYNEDYKNFTAEAFKQVYGTDDLVEYVKETYGQDYDNAGVKLKIQKNDNIPQNESGGWTSLEKEFKKQRGRDYWKKDEKFIDEDGNEWESEEEYTDYMADMADRAYDEWKDEQMGL